MSDDPGSGGGKQVGGVEAVDRALRLLCAFSEHDRARSITLAELSARTGYYKSTVLRLAASLERAGFLVRQADKSFALGPQLMRLGIIYRDNFRLEDHVRPMLLRLLDETGETATFYRRDGNVRIILFREESRHSIRHHAALGTVLPLERGAAGRLLLELDPVLDSPADLRRLLPTLPYVSYGERDREITSVAAPVFWGQPGLAGVIGVSAPSTRMSPEKIAAIAPQLLAVVRDLSARLGGGRFWDLVEA